MLVIFQKKLCIRLRLIMAFSAGRTLVRVNKQVNPALVTDHDPSESSFYLLHVIILVFTRNKNHYHFFSNKTLETDVPVHVNFVFRPVWSCHMQTKIARLICRPQATAIHSRALTKLVFDFKKKEITYSQIINCCIASFRQQMLMRVLGEGVLPNSLHVVDDCRILGSLILLPTIFFLPSF